MKHKRIISFITALTAAFCCAVTSFAPSGKPVEKEATAAVSVYDEYREWSQLDSRWSSTPMGGYSVRSVGCLITSLAIMLVRSGSIDKTAMSNLGISSINSFNPGVLANAYTRYGGFTYGGAIASWLTIEKIVPNVKWGMDSYFKSTYKPSAAKEIKSLMDDGYHVIARVNNGGFHWVYIESVKSDGSIVMCDPARDTHDLYEAYPYGLQGEYWALKGSVAPNALNEGSIAMEITKPDKIAYKYGEPLDFKGGTVTISGVDPVAGKWANKTVPMTDNGGTFKIDSSMYDPYTPGEYKLKVTAEKSYAKVSRYFTVKVYPEACEYVLDEDIEIDVTSKRGGGNVVAALKKGYVVDFSKCDLTYGCISNESFTGWVPHAFLVKAEQCEYAAGDINGDGIVDKYDLSLLNTYIQQSEILPEGIYTLTASQRKAADINGDGVIDNSDVFEYLLII